MCVADVEGARYRLLREGKREQSESSSAIGGQDGRE